MKRAPCRTRAAALVATVACGLAWEAGGETLRAGAAIAEISLSLSAPSPAAARPNRIPRDEVRLYDVPLAGYRERGPGNVGLRGEHPIDARALVVEGPAGGPRVGIVVLDILIVTPKLREAIERDVAKLDLDSVLVAATHTHSGPGGYVDDWIAEVGIMGWYREAVETAIVAAAGRALASAERALVAAELGSAVATVPGVGVNRRRPAGPTDAKVPVLRIDGATGQPIATLFAAAAHPTVYSPANDRLSADYPGAARRFIEAERGGVALFLAGPMGDQKPGVRSGQDWPAELAEQHENARELGELLGRMVVETASFAQLEPDPIVLVNELRWPLPAIDVQWACAGYLFGPALHWAASRLIPDEARLFALRLGGLRVLASPLELGVEVAQAIRARTAGPLLIASHTGGWIGYSLMPKDFEQGGYETCLAFHGPGLAPRFVERAVEVLAPLH